MTKLFRFYWKYQYFYLKNTLLIQKLAGGTFLFPPCRCYLMELSVLIFSIFLNVIVLLLYIHDITSNQSDI